MSIQEPAWLKRTRPCPFFSQGRCLFADSCKFLHDVKVRSAVSQPLRSIIQVKQPSRPPKPVFDPPSVVVNSASPRSDDLASPQSPASPTYDSSRYSGLLSVLSDIIGPPSDPPTSTEAACRATSAVSSSSVHSRTVAGMETGQGTSSRAEPSPTDPEATSVDPFGHQIESLFPETDGEPVAEFLPVSDKEEFGAEDATSYIVEASEVYVIGSEAEGEIVDDEGMNDYVDEDPTVVLSNRQSTLSSFTGASLLASPRHSVFGDSSVSSPLEGGAVDLLSPVELSAKLRPFPIPSFASRVKRGDSIDSGYADGDSWVSPLPFPRSPPRSLQSPVTFLPYSRRASLSSSALRESGVSYDVVTLRKSLHNPVEVIKEMESDGSPENDEDTAYNILDAYNASSSEEQVENRIHDPVQVNVEEKAEEDDEPPEAPAVMRSPRRRPFQHLHPAREYDLDSCNQSSFISDDNLSFRTALSTQPSYDDLNNISRISPVEDSLLPYISGCSTPNTSILSHYDDANELLEQSIVGSHVCESSYLDSSTGAPEVGASEGCPPLEEVAIDSNVLFTSVATDDLQGFALKKVVPPRGSASGGFHFDKHSATPSPSVNTSHDLPPAQDVPGHVPVGAINLGKHTLEKLTTPQDRLSGVFHFDKQPPKPSPPAEHSYSPSFSDPLGLAPLNAGDHLESDAEDVAVWKERLPGSLCHDRRSPKSSPSTSSDSPLGYVPRGTDGMHDRLSSNAVALREHSSAAFYFDENLAKSSSPTESSHSSSSVKDILSHASPDVSDAQGFVSHNVVAPQERLSRVLDLARPSPKPILSSESSHRSPTANESLVVENSLDSDGGTESFDSDSFSQRLSFPLPPFLPVEIVGRSSLGGEEDTSVLTEATVGNLEKDVSNNTVLDEEMERPHLGSDLTEKARPSQLPSVGSPGSDPDFTLRRSRAASDLTVKAKLSPTPTLGATPDVLRSPLPPLEQSGRSDSVQSLYDQYFDDGTSDVGSEAPSPAYRDTPPPDVSGLVEERFQENHIHFPDLIPHVFQTASSSSDRAPGSSGTDSPRSESVLRPLLTGRRSFLRSELIPKADLVNGKECPATRQPTRMQVREIGSTMVPLGFRRHRPKPTVTRPSYPLHNGLPASGLREVLRIRTDIARGDSPPGCFSASPVSFTTQLPLPVKAMSAPPTSGLRELRLSSITNKRSSILSIQSSSIASSILSLDQLFNSSTPQSPSVSSTTSFSHNSSLSSSCAQIPEHIHHTLKRSSSSSLILQANNNVYSASQPLTRRSWRLSHYGAGSRNHTPANGTHRLSRRTSTLSLPYAVDEEQEVNEDDSAISHSTQSKHTDDWIRPASVLSAPVHAIATPKPNLLFAIASDDVDQVRQVLENGEAGPNDSVGPQSALAFTLTNDKLAHKQEIVKALLAYGANPAALRNPTLNPAPRIEEGDGSSGPPPETTLEGMDPATRYFVTRADATHTRQTSQLIYRSFFRPLTRVRYDVIGQDWALEQLFRVLSMHSQKLAVAPIVVLLCGPSGHGKSLLARKFGSLLDVPTHTVNMTTLRSTHDIWQSYSMSPYEEPSSYTLAEFLIENEGKRCVVVLDEIEKVEDQKALWSLLMPWELGRCSLEAGKRHVDARNVIWLGTSNIGHELVFEHHENRAEPDKRMSREDYLELTAMLRPRVSHCLGASVVSRVTTVLPFVPFTLDEKKAIAAEAVYVLAGDASKALSPQDVESLVTKALPSYHPSEGARSLHRAISNILIDAI